MAHCLAQIPRLVQFRADLCALRGQRFVDSIGLEMRH
jgi:hypothetical protein